MNDNWWTMRFTLNNETHELDCESLTLTEMVQHFGLKAERGVAIAINQEVVPRKDWPGHAIRNDDKVLLITATQGG